MLGSTNSIYRKIYGVEMEIAGPTAMWTRPDTGGAMVSYPAPTRSAAKGLFESIAMLKSAYIRPTRVEVCRPIQHHRLTTNYTGVLRKPNQIAAGAPYQLPAVILVDVCYRLYGVVEAAIEWPGKANHLHALQEIFMRRLRNGQTFRQVCLGWSEFVPSYVGPFRPQTKVDATINLRLDSMLDMVFDRPVNGKVGPVFAHDVQIRNGVLEYAC